MAVKYITSLLEVVVGKGCLVHFKLCKLGTCVQGIFSTGHMKMIIKSIANCTHCTHLDECNLQFDGLNFL